jgi:pimeloyl-ACP methyl ester carboxylesterase
MWERQLLALGEAGFRVVAFDRRGHGRSDVPASGYDLDTLADDLARVVEERDLSGVLLVGHSMGAAEVLRYAARHGTSRVARVVLVAPITPFLTATPDNPLGLPAEVVAAMEARWLGDFPGWVEENKPPFFIEGTSPATMDWLARIILATPLSVGLTSFRALVRTDLRPDLAKLDRLTLVIHGDRDVSAPLEITGRPTAAGIPGAELRIYEGAPHGLFITHADRLNRDLIAFGQHEDWPKMRHARSHRTRRTCRVGLQP